jgi:hypothetical protein
MGTGTDYTSGVVSGSIEMSVRKVDSVINADGTVAITISNTLTERMPDPSNSMSNPADEYDPW